MSQVTYRANLSAKGFPFLARNWGRTIIVPQYDNTFSRQLTSPEDTDRDVGLSQIYYCHNVMPHQQGFQSIGYQQVINPVNVSDFITILNLGASSAYRLYVGYTASGKLYTYELGTWILQGTYGAGKLLTTATAQGVTYLYIEGTGCLTYDPTLFAFAPVTLTGLEISAVKGICSVAGYLVAWSSYLPAITFTCDTVGTSNVLTNVSSTTGLVVGQFLTGGSIPDGVVILSIDSPTQITISEAAINTAVLTSITRKEIAPAVYWSSTIDSTDFTPSLTTGAGGGAVESVRGDITCCVAHNLGFVIYTTGNVVIAIYSGNSRFPFNFREIPGSGSLADIEQVTFDANSGNHYAYTTSGLQLVSSTSTQTIFPEVTDFLAGQLLEDFNEATYEFSTIAVQAHLITELSLVSDRYLVISYGVDSLTHALIYDLTSKRWGKLKIDHVTCFEYIVPSSIVTETPRQSIAFFQSNGAVQVVDFSVTSDNSYGVIILGKYQFVRARTLQLDEVDIENIPTGSATTVVDLVALDGKNTAPTELFLETEDGLYRKYLSRTIGLNHSLLIKGSFSLVSLVMRFSVHGKR